jgi:hypothetical protein
VSRTIAYPPCLLRRLLVIEVFHFRSSLYPVIEEYEHREAELAVRAMVRGRSVVVVAVAGVMISMEVNLEYLQLVGLAAAIMHGPL